MVDARRSSGFETHISGLSRRGWSHGILLRCSRLEKVLAELDGLSDDSDLDDELAARRVERLARAEAEGS